MQSTMKKVLSILAVFIVLLSTMIVPVHAEGEKPERETNSINDLSQKGKYVVMGGLKNADDVYAIRLVDTYTDSFRLVRYETKDWVIDAVNEDESSPKRDPIFGKDGAIVSISEEDLESISMAADKKYQNLSAAVEEHEKDVFKLANPGGTTKRNGELPWGLYLVKVETKDGRKFGPAILGVNPDNNEALNLGKKYNGQTELKGEELKLRKSFYFEGNEREHIPEIYTSYYSPLANEEVTFRIDNIFIPDYTDADMKRQNFILEIRDEFDEGVYQIKDAPNFYIHTMGGELRQRGDSSFTIHYGGTLDKYNPKKNPPEKPSYYKDDNKGFIINVPSNCLQTCKGKFISIEYKAIFKGDNESSKEYFKRYVNTAKTTISQKYGRDPEEQKAEAIAYVGEIPFLKYDRDSYVTACADESASNVKFSDAKLEGAEFILTDNIFTTTGGVKRVAVTSKKNGMVTLPGITIDMKEDSKGLDSFDVSKDLGLGIVYFYEEKAPEGFTKSQNRYKIMTNGYQTPEGTLEFVMKVYNVDNLEKPIVTITDKSEIEETEGFWQFPNSKNPYLPSTGSNTMMLLTVIGIALMTGVTVVSRKKKHASSMN